MYLLHNHKSFLTNIHKFVVQQYKIGIEEAEKDTEYVLIIWQKKK